MSKIDFLHRSVYEFLFSEQVYGTLCAGAEPTFNASMAICAATLAFMKALICHNNNCIKSAVQTFLDNAQTSQLRRGYVDERFLDEMEKTLLHRLGNVYRYKILLQVRGLREENEDYLNRFMDRKSIFLPIAIRYGLLDYVTRKMQASGDSLYLISGSQPLRSALIDFTIEGASKASQGRFYTSVWAQMAVLLLGFGANPNELHPENEHHLVTPWVAFMQIVDGDTVEPRNVFPKSAFGKRDEIIISMLAHGADSDVPLGSKGSLHRVPFRACDVALERCLPENWNAIAYAIAKARPPTFVRIARRFRKRVSRWWTSLGRLTRKLWEQLCSAVTSLFGLVGRLRCVIPRCEWNMISKAQERMSHPPV